VNISFREFIGFDVQPVDSSAHNFTRAIGIALSDNKHSITRWSNLGSDEYHFVMCNEGDLALESVGCILPHTIVGVNMDCPLCLSTYRNIAQTEFYPAQFWDMVAALFHPQHEGANFPACAVSEHHPLLVRFS
jgi:hypothetical protein